MDLTSGFDELKLKQSLPYYKSGDKIFDELGSENGKERLSRALDEDDLKDVEDELDYYNT